MGDWGAFPLFSPFEGALPIAHGGPSRSIGMNCMPGVSTLLRELSPCSSVEAAPTQIHAPAYVPCLSPGLLLPDPQQVRAWESRGKW